MNANLHRKLSLKDIAQSAPLSPGRLRPLFKAQTGMTPIRYLRRLRLQKAKRLLETSGLSVKEIAAQVGLSDVSHFVRDFEKACGLAPTAHRVRHLDRRERKHSRSSQERNRLTNDRFSPTDTSSVINQKN